MDAVDLAMVLALDASASVSFEEFGLMAGGTGAAFRSPPVIAGLTAGPARASLLALLLWSGTGAQDVLVDWTRISSSTDANAFAEQVENVPRTVRAGSTAIGEALLTALALLSARPPRRRGGSSTSWATAAPMMARRPAPSATGWRQRASRSTASAC